MKEPFDKIKEYSEEDTPTLYQMLSPLSANYRAAAIGLLGGFGPTILVQTLCLDEAEKIWNLRYRKLFLDRVDDLREKIVINTLAAESIAKNIYCSRNRMMPYALAYSIFTEVHKTFPALNDESVALAVYDIVDRLYHSGNILTESLLNVWVLWEKVDEAISDYLSLPNTVAIDSVIAKKCILEINKYLSWLQDRRAGLSVFKPCDMVISRILLDSFLSNLLPARGIDNVTVTDMLPLARVFKHYEWNLSELYMPSKKGPEEPTPYNEIATESFDSVGNTSSGNLYSSVRITPSVIDAVSSSDMEEAVPSDFHTKPVGVITPSSIHYYSQE